jgi:hypothetical protein
MTAEQEVKKRYPKANIYGGLVITGKPPYLAEENKLTKIRRFGCDKFLWADALRRIKAGDKA